MHELFSLHAFARLLDEDPADPAKVVWRAARVHPPVDIMVIATAIHEGYPHGAMSTQAVSAYRNRTRQYEGLCDLLDQRVGGRAVKGPAIAKYYPSWCPRQSNDLDYLVADENALWKAAKVVRDQHAVTRADITRVSYPDVKDWVLALEWSPADPLLERAMRVEITTDALLASPLEHARLVDEQTPDVDDVIFILAESWERPLGARDVVDCAVIVNSLKRSISTLGPEIDRRGLTAAWTAVRAAAGGEPVGALALPGLGPDERVIEHGYPLGLKFPFQQGIVPTCVGDVVISGLDCFLLTAQTSIATTAVDAARREVAIRAKAERWAR